MDSHRAEAVLNLEGAAGLDQPVVVLGTFDGVHRGHQSLFQRARDLAGPEGQVLALTFDPHPKEVLLPRPPPRLTSRDEKIRRILAHQVDFVLPLAFDRALSQQSAQDFAEGILVEALAPKAIVVGFNFSFGRGGKADPGDLRELLAPHQVPVEVVEPLEEDGIPVSSTSIRVLLQCGDVEAAKFRLGRPHCLTGQVVPGAGRGKGMGFPTANLQPDPSHLVLPKPGVYAGFLEVEGHRGRAVANVGYNPTFAEDPPGLKVEVHGLDQPPRDLYQLSARFDLEFRIRDEVRFDSVEDLKAQIHRDVARALDGLSRLPPLEDR